MTLFYVVGSRSWRPKIKLINSIMGSKEIVLRRTYEPFPKTRHRLNRFFARPRLRATRHVWSVRGEGMVATPNGDERLRLDAPDALRLVSPDLP